MLKQYTDKRESPSHKIWQIRLKQTGSIMLARYHQGRLQTKIVSEDEFNKYFEEV